MLTAYYSCRLSISNVSPVGIIWRPVSGSLPSRRTSTRWRSTHSSSEPGFGDRVKEIQAAVTEAYPRLESHASRLSIEEFRTHYDYLEPNQVVEGDTVVVQGRFQKARARASSASSSSLVLRKFFSVGRIRTARLAGSKLIFFDIVQNDHKIQAMWNLRISPDVAPERFKQLYRLLRRGDAFCTWIFGHKSLLLLLTVSLSGNVSLRYHWETASHWPRRIDCAGNTDPTITLSNFARYPDRYEGTRSVWLSSSRSISRR